MVSLNLEGKTTLVTDAGQGIRAAVAEVFARAGAHAVLATRTNKHGKAVLDRIVRSGGRSLLHITDVGRSDQMPDLVDTTIAQMGRLDIVIHNAASSVSGMVEEHDHDLLSEALDVSLSAAIRLAKSAIAHSTYAGTGRRTAFVRLVRDRTTGRKAGFRLLCGRKKRLERFHPHRSHRTGEGCDHRGWSKPGFILTSTMDLLADRTGHQAAMAKYIPMGKPGTPNDIAHAMLYLASDLAGYITGQMIVVDGGSTPPESPLFAHDERTEMTGLNRPLLNRSHDLIQMRVSSEQEALIFTK
nr:SDR family oxidoreductase [uncultured Paracoccus sp.]